MKDADVESTILRKRLSEPKEDFERFQKLLSESLAVRWELEEKVEDLKHFLMLVGGEIPKSESE